MGVIASAQGILQWGKAHGLAQKSAQPGDIFVIVRASGHGHTGIVVNVGEKGELHTVEGNCANAVRGMIRDPSTVTGYVRVV
jgi:hypothetical protein